MATITATLVPREHMGALVTERSAARPLDDDVTIVAPYGSPLADKLRRAYDGATWFEMLGDDYLVYMVVYDVR